MSGFIDTAPKGPHEPVIFKGGFHVTLEEDGTLIVRATDNKTKRIAVYPRADNAIGIKAEK